MSKLMMLVAAKWRDFTNINPNTEQEPECVSEESYSRKPGRSRTSKDSSKVLLFWALFYMKLHCNECRKLACSYDSVCNLYSPNSSGCNISAM
jgi:hypothetical protein